MLCGMGFASNPGIFPLSTRHPLLLESNPIAPRTAEQVSSTAPAANGFMVGIRRLFQTARTLSEREKNRIRSEIAMVPGMMAMLMRPRNGQKLTREERALLRGQFRQLSHAGLYLIIAVVPGTSLTLPLVAWWLDRRQRRRDDAAVSKTAP
jgi:hypothetical protein